MAAIDCTKRSMLAFCPGNCSGLPQAVTILSSLTPCASAGAGKLPVVAAAAVTPIRMSRRRLVILPPLAQREPPAVAIAGFRQLAPIHDAGKEGHVAVVNLAGRRVLGGDVGEDLLPELAERPDQLVAEAQDLDALVFAQELERLHVLGVELGQRAGDFGLCC